ncbi:ADP-ribosyl cyclase/cyclic ADP-ribose hydrolase 1-like [Girardinichthys multiradiatus]|uniref:ADP-ribosyl cyclase/cyclic ADP-ribose hydrolase 1-like n=1 Tax=Girardinichthys multiradiatus TaxID=208333 RepID=UPI001FAD4485|nr:ADP-ribosyl cyclase/cyclic ADP-ribose hydrolase 1-like [Girardinichthys multiradiatus]
MESGEGRRQEKWRKRRVLILAVIAVILLAVILAIVLGVTLSKRRDDFNTKFMERCQKFKGYNCQKIWDAFQQAYVNRDPCDVPTEAYDPLIATFLFDVLCNRTMFWSKTGDVVHDFTRRKNCFKTVEDTLLGSVLNGLEWCGKIGSNETFTTGCPKWEECEKNAVLSFWKRVSAAFGEFACGNVTVMLNGAITTPFNRSSIFASVEVKKFKFPNVKNLNVVLVIQKNAVTNCTNESLKNLMLELDKGIGYHCFEVSDSHLKECGSDPEKPCGACW